MKLIHIKNSLTHLDDIIIAQLQNVVENQIFSARFLSSDLYNYIKSLEQIDYDYKFAGLEYTLAENNFKFTRSPQIQIGEYTKLGDILTFWAPGYMRPVRIEFFDDNIEKMTFIDPISSRRLEDVGSIYLSNMKYFDEKTELENFKIYSPKEQTEKLSLNLIDSNIKNKIRNLKRNLVIAFSLPDNIEPDFVIDMKLSYPSIYYSRFDILEKDIEIFNQNGWDVKILTNKNVVLPDSVNSYIKPNNLRLLSGLKDNKNKKLILTDRELFGTIFITKEKQKRIKSNQAKKLLGKIEGEIKVGDYVVHEDHGVALFDGIVYEDNQEYLRLKYKGNDELLLPLNKIYKLTKYIGVSDEKPEITALDKISWNRRLERTKKSIKILARDLVRHYAKIAISKAEKIDSINEDEYLQLVEDFGFDETEDQKKTLFEVFEDLKKDKPTNRLIVGDVGFGKTEIALRASFLAVKNKKQVAILAPTTILVAQHFKVFQNRLSKFGIKVEKLSRFNAKYQNKEIVEKIKDGDIDVVIGTHRLLSNDISFKNLALLVIDEEQRFGVKQKEKLRKLSYGVHTLSLTATPIPRTLSMALSQIQDISIIMTPPKGRRPIKTIVSKQDFNQISNAINFEVNRGGQIYFVHNRVQTIFAIANKLQTLLPKVRFVVAHGQMQEQELEKNINDFYAHKYDCLICTTIIENGIDMPNVNTIIINDAQNLGLSQLYQLRGRVGRSTRQAFAYVFYRGEDLHHKDEREDRKFETQNIENIKNSLKTKEKVVKYKQRLEALENITNLGGGFEIARRDLEIRGAGTLLGEKQHGHINKVGLGLYMQMLASEIERLKLKNDSSLNK